MPENRFFLDTPFKKGQSASIEAEEFHHLKVMRKKEGDSIELVNGKNQLAQGEISHIEKRRAQVVLIEVKSEPPPAREILLIQALLRPKNLDLVIEKGTELGATAFWLFPAQKSEKKTLSSSQLSRLTHLTISALKQCGRLDLPQIVLKPPLDQWEAPPPGKCFFGEPLANHVLSPADQISILIGPEQGFTSEEKKLLLNQLKFNEIRLSSNILRAETAAIAALSQVAVFQ